VQLAADELYSLVSFVRPAFLGARNYFKNLYEEPITSGCAAGASSEARLRGEAASSDLKALLCGLMLRRTQDEVLRTLLPARTVATVYLRMTQQQRQEYDLVAARTLRCVVR
jgi:SNF2 family DNA or RNA helicase